jgi:hypothetical protein
VRRSIKGAHFNQFTLTLQDDSELSLFFNRRILFPVSGKMGSDLRNSLIFLNPLKHSCNYMYRVTRSLLPRQSLFSRVVFHIRVLSGQTDKMSTF